MRRCWLPLLLCVGLTPQLRQEPAVAQLPQPPDLPALPATAPHGLESCVPRYGHTGCAARLYAQLLCESVGRPVDIARLEEQLDLQYQQAAINFTGITADQVETAAVRYYAPMLCPSRSLEIQRLFTPS